MFQDMLKTLKNKKIEIFLTFILFIVSDLVYNGYFRWSNVITTVIACFLLYVVYGYFMRREESWDIAEAIEREKFYLIGIEISVAYFWLMGYLGSTTFEFVFYSLCACSIVMLVDKARYLD